MKNPKQRMLILFPFFLFLGILVFAALLSLRHYIRLDLTSTSEHSLSEKTKKVLEKVKEDILLLGFAREGIDEYSQLKRLFAAYEYLSKNIKAKLIDPVRSPSIAQKYNVKQFNTVIVEGYGKTQTVKFPNEENITNAINRLVEGKVRKIAWVIGHNERSYNDEKEKGLSLLKEALEGENFEIHEINLLRESLDSSYDLCVIAGPESAFMEEEKEALEAYLKAAGSIMLFLEPLSDAGLREFLNKNGIIVRDDMVVDKFSKAQGGDFLLPVVVAYADHGITKGFRVATVFRSARSVSTDKERLKEIDLTELAFTSKDSWAETDIEALFRGKVSMDEKDLQGPVCLAAIAEGRDIGQKDKMNGKLVVFGDVDFVSNQFISLGGNRQLVMNTVNYLCSRLDFINIEKIHKPIQPLLLTSNQRRIVFWLPVVAIPLIVLFISLVMWLRRRPK